MNSVEQLKGELLLIWMKRFESLENGEDDDEYVSVAENLIRRIVRQEPYFSSFDYYNANFEAYNPYVEISRG